MQDLECLPDLRTAKLQREPDPFSSAAISVTCQNDFLQYCGDGRYQRIKRVLGRMRNEDNIANVFVLKNNCCAWNQRAIDWQAWLKDA